MYQEIHWELSKGFTLLASGTASGVSNPDGHLRHLGRSHPNWTLGSWCARTKHPFKPRAGVVYRKRMGPGTVDHAFREDKDELDRRHNSSLSSSGNRISGSSMDLPTKDKVKGGTEVQRFRKYLARIHSQEEQHV
jgi:hypothetical protein